MFLFSNSKSEAAHDLDTILSSLSDRQKIKLRLDGKNTPLAEFYVIPTDLVDGTTHAFFRSDEQSFQVPFVLQQKPNFLQRKLYAFNEKGDVVEVRETGNSLPIPVQTTEIKMPLRRGDAEEPGGPFALYSLRGAPAPLPVLFASETEDGIVSMGLYRTQQGGVATYRDSRPTQETLEKIFSYVHGPGLRKTSAKKNETKQSSTKIEETQEPEPFAGINWHDPTTIVEYLNQSVIGQEQAKRTMAVAFSNYVLRKETQDETIPKDNVVLIGPSGVGKTLMASLLAKEAGIPFAAAKLTGKSSEGYKGENLSTALDEIRAKTTGDAPYAVIFFDEIDKLAKTEESSSFGPKLQDELIGWFDEATIRGDSNVVKSGGNEASNRAINTRNILFVTAGAFRGIAPEESIEYIVAKRLNNGQSKNTIGFHQDAKVDSDASDILQNVRPEDLVRYGLKTELVGRLPSIAVLQPLTVEDKVRILTRSNRSALNSYSRILQIRGYEVIIDPAVHTLIAERCPPETGARALNSVCNDLFNEIIFEPKRYVNKENQIHITEDLANKLLDIYTQSITNSAASKTY